MGGKVVEGESPVAIGAHGHCDLGASIVAIVVSAIHAVGQVKLTDRSSRSKAQINRVDLPGLAKLQTSEAHILRSAGSSRVEEVGLVDVDLVVDPVHEIGVDGIQQVLDGF